MKETCGALLQKAFFTKLRDGGAATFFALDSHVDFGTMRYETLDGLNLPIVG